MQIEEFSREVADELKYYVYRLVDPRNGSTFYVGKGKGNRVFEHVKGTLKITEKNKDKLDFEDALSLKQNLIHQIHSEGLEVISIIHRHGMDEKTAFEVESALIDAYPGLTNVANGHGSDYGVMSVKQIVDRYTAAEADLSGFKGCLIIKITPQSVSERNENIYEAVRKAWKLKVSLLRKNTVPYVFASLYGVIRGVFAVNNWFPIDDRIGFEGQEAENLKFYVGKRIPKQYCNPGASNPTLYIK